MARMVVRVYAGPITVLRPELAAFITDPNGGVMKDLVRRGNVVMLVSKTFVRVRTGRLRTLIRLQINAKKAHVTIMAGRPGLTPYTMFEHDGTNPHIITAKKTRGRGKKRRKGMLRFTVGGQVVFRRSVQHPGTTGSQFLVRALPFAAG
jgi:hypothetical protein